MRHPSETQLALFAGGELAFWARRTVGRHVSRCSGCETEVQALRAASGQVRELTDELPAEFPMDLNWNRLAEEMTGNIRVGLAAGEAIARFDKPVSLRPRLAWNAAMVLTCATVVFLAAFWIYLPKPQADHLWAQLQRIRTERIGKLVSTPVAVAPEGVVLEASSSAIEVTQNGRTMTLMHPRSGIVTVSVSLHGSAGVRYVDSDTGQVTTNKVYYAEQ